MRALLLLAALLCALLGAILWRLRQPGEAPPSPLERDPTAAILTIGLAEKPETMLAAPPAAAEPPAVAALPGATDPTTPQPAIREQAPPPVVTRTVGQGETLYAIVLGAYGTAPADLVTAVARANGIGDPSRLRAGQKLDLPQIPGYPDPR